MEKTFKTNCLVCGKPLVYSTESRHHHCDLCGTEVSSEASCEDGHFVCNTCHSQTAIELIEKICIKSNSVKPVNLAVELMKAPSVSMHGPEHHFLVPAVLLTVFYNQKDDSNQKEIKIKVARQRAENILGGFCGFYGACGAGIGTGIFTSLITDSTPLSTETWGFSNQMTAESLRCIGALGGPRCCKRDTFMALKTAKRFLRQRMDVALDVPDTIKCEFNNLNKECIEEKCPFHPKEAI